MTKGDRVRVRKDLELKSIMFEHRRRMLKAGDEGVVVSVHDGVPSVRFAADILALIEPEDLEIVSSGAP